MDLLYHLTYWHWLVFGLVMIALEILLPSAVFVAGPFGIAGGDSGLCFPAFTPIWFILLWALLSVSLAFGWQFYRKRNPATSPIVTMNKRGSQYIGRHFTLLKDITNGVGELNVDDTRWKVVSEKDMPEGTKVIVTSLDGTSLRVEEFISSPHA